MGQMCFYPLAVRSPVQGSRGIILVKGFGVYGFRDLGFRADV